MELETAREIARSQLGDELIASEMMELAIEQTTEYLADLSPIGVEETRAILSRFYRNEVRRRQRATEKLSYRGTSIDMDYLSPTFDTSFAHVEAELDLETILRDTPPDVRSAMLLRYGSRGQWSEVAQIMSRSTEAARKLCERRLKRIRKRLGL
jgi:DNA-directed RNA polymerase specialized sigma24 family protein